MIPVPIPDNQVWEGASRHVIAAPNGDLTDDTIRPVEALVTETEEGRCFAMRIRLEPGELERLARDPHFWLIQYGGHLHPFALTVGE